MTRLERISRLLKTEISGIILKEVSDPRIGFISITDVSVTADLKYAKVFISVYGDEEAKKNTFKGLKSAVGYIQKKLGPRLDMKTVPHITFERDDSIERGDRIFGIISRLKKEKETKVKPKRKK